MKTFAVLLAAIFVSVGSVQARTPSSSLSHAHFPACSEGLVKQLCVCRRGGDAFARHPQLCRSGWYCHTFDGVCRQ
jgi:hypothetical protein